jgi:hypothetical protein
MADVWNKKTRITFSGPVEIPGATLNAGTYVFKLVESQSNRHIVQVQNEREDQTHAVILAIPDYRLNPTSKTVMYFSERTGNNPPAVKSWFYPGDNFGQRFVYPREKAQEIAMSTSQPVPSYEMQTRDPLTVESGRTVDQFTTTQPTKDSTPYRAQDFEKFDAADTAGEEGEIVKQETTISQQPATPAPTPAPEPQPQVTEPQRTEPDSRIAAQAPSTAADEMPATSSPIHLMAGAGGLLLGASLLARRLSK